MAFSNGKQEFSEPKKIGTNQVTQIFHHTMPVNTFKHRIEERTLTNGFYENYLKSRHAIP